MEPGTRTPPTMHDLTSDLPLTEAFAPEYLEYYGVFPVSVADGRLRVAVAGEPCPEVLRDLAESFQAEVGVEEVERPLLLDAIRRTFRAEDSVDALVRSLDEQLDPAREDSEALDTDARDLVNQAPVVRYVNLLIREAHAAGASDVHLESGPTGMSVRFRIDGVLGEASAPPPDLRAAVVSRIKLIGELDIAERRVPQDGRIRIRLEDRDLDLRVSTLPTLFGESVAMRLLDHGAGPGTLGSLGMDGPSQEAFSSLARSPHGMVLVTGPTGSGKTTTLYSVLRLRDIAREKIITIEDPVEYQLPGITQVPVNARSGMTFSRGLRSILRQDPDTVMVGEMRDSETARIAVQAAMTGHLVLSTVHTNDAASAVARLMDLGVEPYLVAATLRGVLGQRLVRQTCLDCAERVPPTNQELSLLRVMREDDVIRRGAGCALCRQTGYSGRIGLFELLVVDDELRALLPRGPDAEQVRDHAVHRGMRLLADDGRRKVIQGVTTPEEVFRAVHA